MQLTKSAPVRARLTAATGALLAAAPLAGQAGLPGKNAEFDAALLLYSETDRVTVIEPLVKLKRELGDDEFLSGQLLIDAMSGASPNGASAADAPQTFTSPSGNSYSASSGETPLRDFRDQRVALTLEWDKPLSRMLRGVFGVDVSGELDYRSLGANATLAWDINDRLTTLTAGTALTMNQIEADGGIPTALAATPDGDPRPVSSGGSEDNTAVDVLFGVTQILSRSTLTQLNFSFSNSDGYLTDPYKLVSVVDGTTGATTGYRFESRPDTRAKQTLYWKLAHQFTEDVLHLSYRYYWDDWGIRTHTVDLQYRYELGGGHFLQPHLRYSAQGEADFYRHSLVDGAALPEHASADYRLGEMTTTTVGLKYGLPLGKGLLNLRAEYMRQSGDSHPSDAIGVQKDQDLFPTVDAFIVNASYVLKF